MCECIQIIGQPKRHDKGCKEMPTPHKHAELIKAWADGAAIEYKDPYTEDWVSREYPKWDSDSEYRIKQTPKPKVTRWLWVVKQGNPRMPWITTSSFYTEKEFLCIHTGYKQRDYKKLEYSATEFDE